MFIVNGKSRFRNITYTHIYFTLLLQYA